MNIYFKPTLLLCILSVIISPVWAQKEAVNLKKSGVVVKEIVIDETPILVELANSEIDLVNQDAEFYQWADAVYFISPIIGANYTDVTQIAPTFFNSQTGNEVIGNGSNNNNGNGLPVDQTSMSWVVGVLIDGQYRMVSAEYWRAGFQTGFIYSSAIESKFKTDVCTPTNICTDGNNSSEIFDVTLQPGTLNIKSFQVPILFTFSKYAVNDLYIVTLKLGPSFTRNMFDTNFAGFELDPTYENEFELMLGIDGRYKLGQSSTMLLVGFIATLSSSFGSGGSTFSGVESLGGFEVYTGISF